MKDPSVIEYLVFATVLGLMFLGSTVLGIFIGYKIYQSAQNTKRFTPPDATERAQAIRERAGEDKTLKGFMDAYSKGFFMTQEDFKQGGKEKKKANV